MCVLGGQTFKYQMKKYDPQDCTYQAIDLWKKVG